MKSSGDEAEESNELLASDCSHVFSRYEVLFSAAFPLFGGSFGEIRAVLLQGGAPQLCEQHGIQIPSTQQPNGDTS